MNRKFFKFPMFFIMIFAVFQTTVLAWMPDRHFWCEVDISKIPQDTAYIDLLLPISSDDVGYSSCNQFNCEKFNLSSETQIVSYSTDGYKSYTFHFNDSYSEMTPIYFCNFSVPDTIYNSYPDLFNGILEDCTLHINGEMHFNVQVSINSSKEKKLEDLSEVIDIGLSNSKTQTFVEYYNYKSEYGFEYLCKKYKTAKMAYIDKNGNILEVTNQVKIKTFRSSPQLHLKLSGSKFSSDPSYGPPIYLLVFIPFILFIIFIFITIILLTHEQIKKKKIRDYIIIK